MAEEAVRIGLIGAGRNTRERHIPGFRQVEGVEVAAVANRSRQSGQQVADAFNIPTVYDNWQELLEDPSLDAICIGTWPYMHSTLTVAALEKGKHVLCEKPFTSNAAEARRLAATADEVGLVLMEAFHYRYHPLMRRAVEVVGRGVAGEFHRVRDDDGGDRIERAATGELEILAV